MVRVRPSPMRDGTDEGRISRAQHFRALLRDKSQGLDHDVVDADPVAACVQEIMATRSAWTGSGTDLLRAAAGLTGDGSPRGTPAGPNIHVPSPVAFAGLRPSCGQCASTLPSVVKAPPEIGSSGCVRSAKIPSAPSAACARVGRDPPQDNLRRSPPRLRSQPWTRFGARPVTTSSRRQTRPTVLPQAPRFVSGSMRVL